MLFLAELGVMVMGMATLLMGEISTQATSVATEALHLMTMAMVAPEEMSLVVSSVRMFCSHDLQYQELYLCCCTALLPCLGAWCSVVCTAAQQCW